MKETQYVVDGKKVTYEILENGYMIYLDNVPWISQIEPYIPDRSLSYEDNCLKQLEDICANRDAEPEVDVTAE